MQPFPGTTTEPLPECQPSPERFKLEREVSTGENFH